MSRLPKAMVVVLAVLAGGCSATTWRHDTFRDVEVDGRPLIVSWLVTEKREFDLMVFDETPATAREPLDVVTARHAAGRFIIGKCGRHVTWMEPTRSFVDHRHAFRVRCGHDPVPQQ
jgi:hypothetical protein